MSGLDLTNKSLIKFLLTALLTPLTFHSANFNLEGVFPLPVTKFAGVFFTIYWFFALMTKVSLKFFKKIKI